MKGTPLSGSIFNSFFINPRKLASIATKKLWRVYWEVAGKLGREQLT